MDLMKVLLLLLLCFEANAEDDETLELARRQHALGLYELSNETLEEDYDDGVGSVDVMDLYALNLEKQGELKEAIAHYNKAIKKHFRQSNTRAFKYLLKKEKRKVKKPRPPEDLLYIYFRKSQLHGALLQRDFFKMRKKKRASHKKLYEIYSQAARSFNHMTDEIQEYQETFQTELAESETHLFDGRWEIQLDWISFNDTFDLVNSDETISNKVIGTLTGVGIQLAHERRNVRWGYAGEFGMYLASGEYTLENGSGYNPETTAVGLFSLAPSLRFYPNSENVMIGISLPLYMKSGDYVPTESLEADATFKFHTSYKINSRFLWGRYFAQLSFSKIFGLPDSMWSLGIGYGW